MITVKEIVADEAAGQFSQPLAGGHEDSTAKGTFAKARRTIKADTAGRWSLPTSLFDGTSMALSQPSWK
jgi:hypothetical protein